MAVDLKKIIVGKCKNCADFKFDPVELEACKISSHSKEEIFQLRH